MNDISEMHYDCIEQVENFYMDRMSYLVNEEQFDDSHALFTEFVVDTEEPDEWIFVQYLSGNIK